VNGDQMKQLTSFEGASVGSPRWSPDNMRIVFDAALRGQSAIWLIDADGNNLHRLNNSTVREYLPTWSRDGKWVYFVSLRGGSEQLWKQNPNSGEINQVTSETLFDAVESPIGDVIFAQKPQGAIWQIPHEGAPVPVPELSDARPARYWSLAESKIYFVRHEKTPRELDYFDLRTRQIHKLTDIAGALLPGTPGIAVDPHSGVLLFVERNRARSTIVLQEMQQ
jgi:dipeptidyl aminopeptidase/acylaminoacyl peptidase